MIIYYIVIIIIIIIKLLFVMALNLLLLFFLSELYIYSAVVFNFQTKEDWMMHSGNVGFGRIDLVV